MSDPKRTRRIEHLVIMGIKLVLLGLVGLIALDGPWKFVAVGVGIVLEICAVVCFAKALIAARGPRAPAPVETYSELQESMRQLRETEAAEQRQQG